MGKRSRPAAHALILAMAGLAAATSAHAHSSEWEPAPTDAIRSPWRLAKHQLHLTAAEAKVKRVNLLLVAAGSSEWKVTLDPGVEVGIVVITGKIEGLHEAVAMPPDSHAPVVFMPYHGEGDLPSMQRLVGLSPKEIAGIPGLIDRVAKRPWPDSDASAAEVFRAVIVPDPTVAAVPIVAQAAPAPVAVPVAVANPAPVKAPARVSASSLSPAAARLKALEVRLQLAKRVGAKTRAAAQSESVVTAEGTATVVRVPASHSPSGSAPAEITVKLDTSASPPLPPVDVALPAPSARSAVPVLLQIPSQPPTPGIAPAVVQVEIAGATTGEAAPAVRPGRPAPAKRAPPSCEIITAGDTSSSPIGCMGPQAR